MIKKRNTLILSILTVILVLGLSACTLNISLGEKESSLLEDGEVSDNTIQEGDPSDPEEPQKEAESQKEKEEISSEKSEEESAVTSNLSLEDAKKLFSNNYPDATIEVAKTEGNAYYIQGYEGSDICKMKILSQDGSILMSKRITTGRQRGR